MRSYSTRPLERAIGKYSKLIKSSVESGVVNASNVIERLSVRGYINFSVDMNEELEVIATKPYKDSTFINSPSEEAGSHQLWAPIIYDFDLQSNANNNSTLFGQPVSHDVILDALVRYYACVLPARSIFQLENRSITVAARAWIDLIIYSSSFNKRCINEYRRGNHYIMFKSNVIKQVVKKKKTMYEYLLLFTYCNRNSIQLHWFIGKIIFFISRVQNNQEQHLVLVEVAKKHKACPFNKSVPLVMLTTADDVPIICCY